MLRPENELFAKCELFNSLRNETISGEEHKKVKKILEDSPPQKTFRVELNIQFSGHYTTTEQTR